MQKIALIFFSILFLGCSVKEKPIYVSLKTPSFKISDEGFLKKSFGYKEIIIYRLGQVPVKIRIKNSTVCISHKCMDKIYFNKILCPKCSFDVLDYLLNKKSFPGKFIKTSYGFIQKNKFYIYKVSKNMVLFKTKKVLFFIKFLKDIDKKR